MLSDAASTISRGEGICRRPVFDRLTRPVHDRLGHNQLGQRQLPPPVRPVADRPHQRSGQIQALRQEYRVKVKKQEVNSEKDITDIV